MIVVFTIRYFLALEQKEKFRSKMQVTAFGKSFGRVNILGEHLDYNGGFVMPLQLKLGVQTKISENKKSRNITIRSNDYDDIFETNHMESKNHHWSDFALGSCKYIRDKYQIDIKDIIIDISSDLPIGIGLSSSAATNVSILKSLVKYFKIEMSKIELANAAFDVENKFVGVGGGIMDQYASVFGESSKVLYLNTLNNDYEKIPVFNTSTFLIIDSGIKRILEQSDFNKKKVLCISAAKKLKVNFLSNISDIEIIESNALNKNEYKVVKHVVSENIRTKKGKDALLSNNYEYFGELMTQSHNSLAKDFEVSINELDTIVNLCNKFGAYGAKLTGAGFGGAVVTLVENDKVKEFKENIVKRYNKAKFI